VKKFKRICLTFIQGVRQRWLNAQTMATGHEQRRRLTVPDLHESERLDRLRNPSKYQGR
jgi:hypothetical protein